MCWLGCEGRLLALRGALVPKESHSFQNHSGGGGDLGGTPVEGGGKHAYFMMKSLVPGNGGDGV